MKTPGSWLFQFCQFTKHIFVLSNYIIDLSKYSKETTLVENFEKFSKSENFSMFFNKKRSSLLVMGNVSPRSVVTISEHIPRGWVVSYPRGRSIDRSTLWTSSDLSTGKIGD